MNRFHKGLICVLLCFFIVGGNQAFSQQKPGYIASLGRQNHWVDSVYKKLSKKQRIAQLFFVRAHTNRGQAYEDSVGSVIRGGYVSHKWDRDGMTIGQDSDGDRWTTSRWQGMEPTTVTPPRDAR